jgi:hypothetical protein
MSGDREMYYYPIDCDGAGSKSVHLNYLRRKLMNWLNEGTEIFMSEAKDTQQLCKYSYKHVTFKRWTF